MKVSHLALERKTDSNKILWILLLLCLKGIACWMFLKCPNIYGIHMHAPPIWDNILNTTVVPARSDSDLKFVYKVIRDLESIDHLCINPIRRIGLIHKWSIDSH